MAKDNYGLLLTSLVAMVAVVGLVILFGGQKEQAPVVVETPQQYAEPAPAMTFGQQYGQSGYTPKPYTQPAWQTCMCRDGSVGKVTINARCAC